MIQQPAGVFVQEYVDSTYCFANLDAAFLQVSLFTTMLPKGQSSPRLVYQYFLSANQIRTLFVIASLNCIKNAFEIGLVTIRYKIYLSTDKNRKYHGPNLQDTKHILFSPNNTFLGLRDGDLGAKGDEKTAMLFRG